MNRDTKQKILSELSRSLSFKKVWESFPECSMEDIRLLLKEASEKFKNEESKVAFKDGGKSLKIYTDGASRGNPGQAGAGIVIYNKGKVIKEISKYLGETTNNVAEYWGLLLSLENAYQLGAEEVEVFSDSELLTKQINGSYRVRDKKLSELYQRAFELIDKFKKFSLVHISREDNKRADKLANQAIDRMPKQAR